MEHKTRLVTFEFNRKSPFDWESDPDYFICECGEKIEISASVMGDGSATYEILGKRLSDIKSHVKTNCKAQV